MKNFFSLILFIFILTPSIAFADLTTNLVSYWKLDQTVGNAVDSVTSNTLTNNNVVTYIPAVINNGANFVAATSQNLSISDAAQSGLDITGDLSISFWIYSVSGSNGFAVAKWKDAGSASYEIRVSNSGDSITMAVTDGSNFDNITESFTMADNTWYHIVCTYNASAKKIIIYGNGSAISAGQSTVSGSIANSDASFRFAANSNSSDVATNFINGRLDEIGIWNRVLTSSEVSSLYNGGSGSSYPFAVALPQSSIFNLIKAFWW